MVGQINDRLVFGFDTVGIDGPVIHFDQGRPPDSLDLFQLGDEFLGLFEPNQAQAGLLLAIVGINFKRGGDNYFQSFAPAAGGDSRSDGNLANPQAAAADNSVA